MEITLDEAVSNYGNLLASTSYTCYKFNRDRSPDITPEQWGKILPNVPEMEKLYQLEKGGQNE